MNRSKLFLFVITLSMLIVLSGWAQDSSGVNCLNRFQIRSRSVKVSDDYAYITADSVLTILNIRNIDSCFITGSCNLPAEILGFDKSGNNLFIATDSAGLVVLDVSNPLHPSITTSLSQIVCNDIAIHGNFAFIATLQGYSVINIQNPDSIRMIDSQIIGFGGSKIAVNANKVYLLAPNFYGNNDMDIFDITNPISPRFVRTLMSGYSSGFTAVNCDNIRTFVGSMERYTDSHGFEHRTYTFNILDISETGDVVVEGSCNVSGSISTIKLTNEFALIVDATQRLTVLNISNHSNPEVIGYYDTPGIPSDVAIVGNVAFVAEENQLAIYDCSQILSVEKRFSETNPISFAFLPNYPNPFNATTTIKYAIAQTGKVSLKVFDLTGREVTSLVDFRQDPGEYSVKFDGSRLAAGTYFVRLQAGAFSKTQKIVLLK